MKRFYTEVAVAARADGVEVLLDGRPIRTPARAPLRLPTDALAAAVAAEWRAQGEDIDPRAMPMTGLSNAAIDQIAPDPAPFAAGIAAYGQSDLLCYRADGPAALVARQAAMWNPLLAWAARRHGATLAVTAGVLPVAQPADALARLGAAVAALDPFRLGGLSTLVTLAGSLVIGLAVLDDAIVPEDGWAAADLDDRWQAERWGEDAEAAARNAMRRAEFLMAADYIRLL